MAKETKEMSPEGARLVFWGFVVLTVVAVLFAVGTDKERRRYKAEAVKVPGTVVAMVDAIGTNPNECPEVIFRTEGGEQHKFRSHQYVSPGTIRKGDKVQVYYFSGRPDSARIGQWVESSFRTFIASAFVLGFLFFATLIGRGLAKQKGPKFLFFGPESSKLSS